MAVTPDARAHLRAAIEAKAIQMRHGNGLLAGPAVLLADVLALIDQECEAVTGADDADTGAMYWAALREQAGAAPPQVAEALTVAKMEQLEWLAGECNKLKWGHCQTRACFERAGWREGSPKGFIPTCVPLEIAKALRAHRPRGNPDDKLRDVLTMLAEAELKDGGEGNIG